MSYQTKKIIIIYHIISKMFDNLTIKKYDKITEYANSLFNIYKIISKKSEINSDNRLRAISHHL